MRFSCIRTEAVVSRSCSVKKSVLENFTKFTGKHLCQTLAKVFSCDFLEIFRNTCFNRTPPVAASDSQLIFFFQTIALKLAAGMYPLPSNRPIYLNSFQYSAVNLYCIKYLNFTYFHGVKILQKRTVCAEFRAIHPHNSADTVHFYNIFTPENYRKMPYFVQLTYGKYQKPINK